MRAQSVVASLTDYLPTTSLEIDRLIAGAKLIFRREFTREELSCLIFVQQKLRQKEENEKPEEAD